MDAVINSIDYKVATSLILTLVSPAGLFERIHLHGVSHQLIQHLSQTCCFHPPLVVLSTMPLMFTCTLKLCLCSQRHGSVGDSRQGLLIRKAVLRVSKSSCMHVHSLDLRKILSDITFYNAFLKRGHIKFYSNIYIVKMLHKHTFFKVVKHNVVGPSGCRLRPLRSMKTG